MVCPDWVLGLIYSAPPPLAHPGVCEESGFVESTPHRPTPDSPPFVGSQLGGDLGPTVKMFVYKKQPPPQPPIPRPRPPYHILPFCPLQQNKQPGLVVFCCSLAGSCDVGKAEWGVLSVCLQVPVWLARPVLRQVYPTPRMCAWHLHRALAVPL